MVYACGARDFAGELRRLVRVAEQRSGRKIDRASLARAIHISPQSLYAYLAGSRLPPATTLDALLIELGVSGGQMRRLAGIRDQVEESRRAPAVPLVRYSLPADTAAFTGRDEELRKVVAAVGRAGGVVAVAAIDGMPGVGKTTLAIHAAHVLAAEFPDWQMFIDLHAHTPGHEPVPPEEALAGLLAATGVDPRYLPGDLAGRAAMWRDRMAGRRALLVLDNAASGGQVTPLLPGAGGCLVLVTSRRHLADLPGAVTPVLLDVLAPQEASDMFIRLAPRAADDRDGVAEILRGAGCLPLAVSLLARVFARHPSWTLGDLAAEGQARVLTLAAENDSVAAAFEVSYRLLDPAAQRLFRLLGVHPGGPVDSYAAGALAGSAQEEAAGLLDGLHREGLVTEVGYRRYGTHDLLRRYARELAVSGDAAADSQQGLERLLDYYQCAVGLAGTRLARQTRPGPAASAPAMFELPDLEDTEQALAWARADQASLLACLDLAAGAGQHARVVAFAAGLGPLWKHDGPWAQAVTWHAAAVDAARRLGARLAEANALADLGDARQLTDDYPGATTVLEEALRIYRDLGERLGEANVLTTLGMVRQLTDDHLGAAGVMEDALSIYREISDRPGESNVLTGLGVMRCLLGDYLGAAGLLEDALGLCRDLHNRLGEANALLYLGIVGQMTGDYPVAAEVAEDALRIFREIGSRSGEANALNVLGDVRSLTDYPGAAGFLEDALSIHRDLGHRLGEANTLRCLGRVWRLTGDYPRAAGAVADALSIYRDLGNRQSQAETLTEQGALHRARGDLVRAEQCHRQALDLARAIGSAREEACALAGLGRCAEAAGRNTEAIALLRQAHQIFERIGAPEAQDVLAELGPLTARPQPT